MRVVPAPYQKRALISSRLIAAARASFPLSASRACVRYVAAVCSALALLQRARGRQEVADKRSNYEIREREREKSQEGRGEEGCTRLRRCGTIYAFALVLFGVQISRLNGFEYSSSLINLILRSGVERYLFRIYRERVNIYIEICKMFWIFDIAKIVCSM